MKMTKELYGQFLLSSHINYTCTYLADHFDGLTHDNVQYFLARERIAPRDLWKMVRHGFVPGAEGYVIFDDTVLNKEHSRKIEIVRTQWSGNEGGLIRGIGLINCVYFNAVTNQFWLLDYRLYAPADDGKTKPEHVQDMLQSLKQRGIVFRYLLMDSWYATSQMMKWAMAENKVFYCPLKTNRKVDDSGGQKKYVRIDQLQWNDTEKAKGKTIKVHKMPMDTYFKLFRVVLSTERTDYVVTNDITQHSTHGAEEKGGIRWTVEQLHREEKQTTGIEACQCRKGRSQRNHIAMAALVWTKLKNLAYQSKKTIYQLKHAQLDDYLIQQLLKPTIRFA